MMFRFFAAVALLALLTGCRSSDAGCPTGFLQLDGGTCLALPAGAGPDTQVAIFLHGTTPTRSLIFPGAAALAAACTDAGVALLVPFGTRGLCSWSDDAKQLMCWPTVQSHADALRELERRIDRDLRQVEKRLGAKEPIVPAVIGFSNGGFAASRLAAEGSMPMRSLVVLQAGGTPPITFPAERHVQTLLQAARDDEWQFPTMQRLRQQLQNEGWPATWVERDGPHRLLPEDIEAAVRFLAPSQVAADQR